MKKMLIGIGIGVMLTLSTAAYASDSIQALIFQAKIKINGQEKQMDSEYQILNVNGHAYVPIRYVAENTGINIDYDDNTQMILLAYGKPPIQDVSDKTISVSDLIVSSFDKYLDSTKITGHISLDTDEAKYVNASLEFYDSNNNLLGTATIDDDFVKGTNNFNIRGSKDLTNFSNVLLKLKDVHPAMKLHIASLFEAAERHDQVEIQKNINSLSPTEQNVLLIDFIKRSVSYDNELRNYIFPEILKKSTDINNKDIATGKTALIYASVYAIDLIKPLIDAGADVNALDNDGSSALLLIASKNSPDLIKMLLEKGANPNITGINNTTPLLAALRPMFGKFTTETVSVVSYLLEAGANVNVKDQEGATPLQIVQKNVADVEIKTKLESILISKSAE